jgi:excinuclease UvrABC helicase subunit UvrB
MNLKEIFDNIGSFGLFGTAIALLTIIEVTPIKVNPWSSLLKIIGRALNAEIMEKLKETNTDEVRYRILRFDDEIRHKMRHTEEHYDQIIADIDKYEIYCKQHPNYENNKAKMAVQNIKKTYEKCKQENSFLV